MHVLYTFDHLSTKKPSFFYIKYLNYLFLVAYTFYVVYMYFTLTPFMQNIVYLRPFSINTNYTRC